MALSSKSQGEYILKATMELSSEIQLGAFRLAWEMVVRPNGNPSKSNFPS